MPTKVLIHDFCLWYLQRSHTFFEFSVNLSCSIVHVETIEIVYPWQVKQTALVVWGENDNIVSNKLAMVSFQTLSFKYEDIKVDTYKILHERTILRLFKNLQDLNITANCMQNLVLLIYFYCFGEWLNFKQTLKVTTGNTVRRGAKYKPNYTGHKRSQQTSQKPNKINKESKTIQPKHKPPHLATS